MESSLRSIAETRSSLTVFTTAAPHLLDNIVYVNESFVKAADQGFLPNELQFNTNALVQVIVYCILFVVAAAGNVPVFVTLLRNRHRKSRIKLMIMHLAIADLIVTFVMIPLEVVWRLTVQWLAGDAMCKLMQLLRAFGPYLSSMVLVCISLDRYFAILHPLKVNDAQRRGKIMIAMAWIISFVCSVPQAVIFHVSAHPDYPDFSQCVTFDFFPSDVHERIYNLFCLLALYGVPLLIIVYCYSQILWEIYRRSRDSQGGANTCRTRTGMRLRRSDAKQIEKARNRTLRLTIIIVLAFFWCWTPYVIMVMWYQFDPKSAEHVNSYLQSSLFMFAVSNSCVNPVVYGSYTTNFRRRLFPCCANRNSRTAISTNSSVYGSSSAAAATSSRRCYAANNSCSESLITNTSSQYSVYPSLQQAAQTPDATLLLRSESSEGCFSCFSSRAVPAHYDIVPSNGIIIEKTIITSSTPRRTAVI